MHVNTIWTSFSTYKATLNDKIIIIKWKIRNSNLKLDFL